MPSQLNFLSNKRLYASLLVLAPLLANVSVNAADVDELEEVIVSADFRETTLDDSTVSITVTSEEEIKARGAEHIEETLNTAPNVNVASGASRARFVQIRGIGERSQFDNPVIPSVGLYIDGIELSRSGGSATLFDVEQVEVIRGPQGTKFGENALAGLINIQSTQPTNEWEGKIKLGAGNFNKETIGVAVGGPLIKEKLLGRFSLHSNKSDGFTNNTFLNRDDTNNIDEVTAKGHLKWLASDDLTVDLKYLHIDVDNGFDSFSLNNDRTTQSDDPGRDSQNTDAISIKTDWDINDKVTLETSTSYSDSDSVYSFDEDWSFINQFDPGLFPYQGFDQYERNRQNTALEARLLSGDEGKIFNGKTDWVAGVFHSDRKENSDRTLTRNFNDVLDPSQITVANTRYDYDTKNTAIYGQLDTQLTSKTKLITGLRVERFSADFVNSNGLNESIDETLVGGKLGIEYEINDNHLTHATISRGYKPGGINQDDRLPNNQRRFETESLLNFEIGINSSFLNDKINTRVSAFYAQRRDQQTSNNLNPEPQEFIGFTSNASSGSNFGLEAELDWTVNDKLTLKTSLGLLEADFDEFVLIESDDDDLPVSRDFSGRDQAHAPNYQYSIGAEYKIKPSLTAGLTFEGKDGFFFSDSNNERADSYNVVNANLTYKRKNITTTLWARNLLDEDYDTRGFFFGNNPGNGYTPEVFTQKGEPRVFGVNLSIDF